MPGHAVRARGAVLHGELGEDRHDLVREVVGEEVVRHQQTLPHHLARRHPPRFVRLRQRRRPPAPHRETPQVQQSTRRVQLRRHQRPFAHLPRVETLERLSQLRRLVREDLFVIGGKQNVALLDVARAERDARQQRKLGNLASRERVHQVPAQLQQTRPAEPRDDVVAVDGTDRPLAARLGQLRAEQTAGGLDAPHAHVGERVPEMQRKHRRDPRAEGVTAQHQRPALVPARLVVLQALVPRGATGRVRGLRRGRLLPEEHLVQHPVPLEVRQDEVGGVHHPGVAVQLRAAQVRHAYRLRVEHHGLVHGVRDAVLHGHRAAHGHDDRLARRVARDEVGLLAGAVGEGDVKQILPADPRARLQRLAVQALRSRLAPVVRHRQAALRVDTHLPAFAGLRGAAAAAALPEPARAARERQAAARVGPRVQHPAVRREGPARVVRRLREHVRQRLGGHGLAQRRRGRIIRDIVVRYGRRRGVETRRRVGKQRRGDAVAPRFARAFFFSPLSPRAAAPARRALRHAPAERLALEPPPVLQRQQREAGGDVARHEIGALEHLAEARRDLRERALVVALAVAPDGHAQAASQDAEHPVPALFRRQVREDAEDERDAEEVARDDEVVAHDDDDDGGVHVVAHVAAVPDVVVQERAERGEAHVRDGQREVHVQQRVDVRALVRLQDGALQRLPQDQALQAHAQEETRERAEQPRHRGLSRRAPSLQTLVRALVHEQDHRAPAVAGVTGCDGGQTRAGDARGLRGETEELREAEEVCGSLGGCAPHNVHHHQAHHGDGEVIRRDQPRAAEQAERRHPGRTTRPRRDECLGRSRRGQGKPIFVNTHAGGFLWRKRSGPRVPVKSQKSPFVSRFTGPRPRATAREAKSLDQPRPIEHFTAAAPKPPPLGENQVSVAPLAHCETRLEGTLSPRLSLARADALVS